MTDKKICLLKEVIKRKTVEQLSERLNFSVEFVERLKILAKRLLRTGGK